MNRNSTNNAVLDIREHNINGVSCKNYTTWTANLIVILTLTQYFDISFSYCWRFRHSRHMWTQMSTSVLRTTEDVTIKLTATTTLEVSAVSAERDTTEMDSTVQVNKTRLLSANDTLPSYWNMLWALKSVFTITFCGNVPQNTVGLCNVYSEWIEAVKTWRWKAYCSL